MKNFKDFLYMIFENEDETGSVLTSDDFIKIYKMNYQYDMMKQSRFQGHPTRRDNMLKGVIKKATPLTEKVLDGLILVFHEWLEHHALLDAEKWAEKRTEDVEVDFHGDNNETFILSPYYEYLRYSERDRGNIYPWSMDVNNKIDEFLNDYFDKVFHQYTIPNSVLYDNWVDVIKDDLLIMFQNDLSGLDVDDDDYEEVNQKINNLETDPEDIIRETLYADLLPLLQTAIDNNYINGEKLSKELYQYMVFPLWEEYWMDRGIADTRNTIEDIYSKLIEAKESNDLSNRFKIINIAINAVHQGGRMFEYIIRKFDKIDYELLDDLSNQDVTEYNNELKRAGFMVDDTVKWEPYTESFYNKMMGKLNERFKQILESTMSDLDVDKTEFENQLNSRFGIELDKYRDQLVGGVADNLSVEEIVQVPIEELLKGIEVEFEHTNDPYKAMEIALDHLFEKPPQSFNYYKMLAKGESELGI